jgi:hypothetical protein
VENILSEYADVEAVKSFIAYRKKQRKPLTLTAAKRLSDELRTITDRDGDPSDALGMAEERGWQTVKADWYFKGSSKGANNENHLNANKTDRLQRIVSAAASGTSSQDWG